MTSKRSLEPLSWQVPAVAIATAAPFAHPLLLAVVGVPSHLLWFSHVLPVALVTFGLGSRAAVIALSASAALVAAGEASFGAGYGRGADVETVLSLAVAVSFANALVAGFAIYARDAAARYQSLFDGVGIGVLRVAGDSRVVAANPAPARLLGWEEADRLAGRALAAVLAAPPLDSLERLSRDGAWTGPFTARGPAGEAVLHGIVAAVPDAATRGYQVLLADRTLEVLQDAELERREKLAALGEALAGVAHELSNPLFAILAHAELFARRGGEGLDGVAMMRTIGAQARRMRDLVGDLLGFSRGHEEETCFPVDETVRRIVRIHTLAARGVRFETRLGNAGIGAAAPSKVEQVVLNLLTNAIHAVENGGGTAVTVSTSRSVDLITVEVSDDGPGIDPAVLPRLFQPFATTKPRGEGTGLGLAISRRLARAWGGDLTAVEGAPRGARFRLTIPAGEARDPMAVTAPGAVGDAPLPGAAPAGEC